MDESSGIAKLRGPLLSDAVRCCHGVPLLPTTVHCDPQQTLRHIVHALRDDETSIADGLRPTR